MKAFFTVDDDALMVAQTAQLMRFDLVLLGFGIVHVAFTGAEPPRALHHAFLAKKVSSLNGIGFVGSAEDHPVAEIQGEYPRFVVAERWHE